MKFLALKLFIFVFVLYNVNAKRWGGGGSSSRGSSGSRWGSSSNSRPSHTQSRPSYTPQSRPVYSAPPRKQTSDFLFSESGRPSRPANHHSNAPTGSHHISNAPVSSGSHTPSAPTHSSGSHNPNGPTSFHNSAPYPVNNHPSAPVKPNIVQESNQKSHATPSHTDPYAKQPAQNPYVPTGGYHPGGAPIPAPPHGISGPVSHPISNSPPYPVNQPNHPHPSPGFNSHPPPPYSANPPPYQQHYSGVHGAPPPYSAHPYPSINQHPSYSHPPAYHPPAYSPPTQPFVPGKTVYVMQDGHSSSRGPGLGTYIGSAVAGGVAAGATNAIVDHAISAIFRPSSHNVHTYPSAPPVGTPTTVTHTTNNYYYGSGPSDNTGNTNANQGSSGTPVNNAQPAQAGTPNNAQPAQAETPQDNAQPPSGGTVANSGLSSAVIGGSPSSQTNGVASRAPEQQGQPETPAPSNEISDEDLMKFTEVLFDKVDRNLNQYVDLNLQKRVTSVKEGEPVPDEAQEPLFNLKPDLDTVPTISTLRALYDNYEHDGTKKENLTPERRNEENAFIDEIVKTPVMSTALTWLGEKKYIESDNYEQKDLMRRMWFNVFDETSSGFERIFLSEKFESAVVGLQNWVYFANLEAQKKVNYMGYVDMLSLSGKGSLLKMNYQTEGYTIQNATIFVGTPPELELALYTVCFHARPGNWCPVSLGGAKFFILTHSFRYFGKDLIDLGFPTF